MKEAFWRTAIIFLVVFGLVFLAMLSMPKAAEYNISYGETTFIHSIAHTNNKDSYALAGFGVRFDNDFELSIVKHKYFVEGDHFDTVSFGVVKHWTLRRGIFFTDLGLGLRYGEKDRRIKWLMHKHLLSDFSGAVGVELGDFKLSVGLRHFSCPGSDAGQNLDEITIMFRREF